MGRFGYRRECGWLASSAGNQLGAQRAGVEMVLQLTRAVVAVGSLADPAAVEMGEAAASGTGGSEVDADVVQV